MLLKNVYEALNGVQDDESQDDIEFEIDNDLGTDDDLETDNGIDINLSEFDKGLLVTVFLAGESGVNEQSIFGSDDNENQNIESSFEKMLKLGFIESANLSGFYKISDDGIASMKRESLLNDSGELIDAHTKKYIK